MVADPAVADPPPPYNCDSHVTDYTGDSPDRGTAWCSSGTGWVRVRMTCMDEFGRRTTRYGPWRTVPNEYFVTSSAVLCSTSYPYGISAAPETMGVG